MGWRVATWATLCVALGVVSVSAYLSPSYMAGSNVSGPPPSTGLQIYLPLTGDYLDQSGNGNNGTPAGSPAFATTSWGTALNCDGVDDRVTIASDPSFANPLAFSFAACVNARSGGESGNGRIYDWDDGSGGDAGLLAWRSAIMAFQGHDERYATTRAAWHTGNASISFNTTYHVVWTYDSSTQTPGFYINGAPVTPVLNDTPAGAFDPTTGDLHVCNALAQTDTFDGFVGHFRMYNEVISAGTVTTIAQDCTTPPTGTCPGDTCYVRLGGSDANDCSDPGANACATAQRAVDQANCGDTVDIGAGTFSDMRTVVSKNCSAGSILTIRGQGAANTTVDGDTPITSLPGPPTWSLEGGPTYPDNNVYSIALGLGRLGHMRNGATGESFRLISDACMDGTRTDCWSGTNKDGDWLLNQGATDLFTERINDINAWTVSRIRFGTKSNNRTYFREQNGVNPSTLDLRVCASSGNAANTFTISGNYITLQDMTIIGCRRNVYITGTNVVVQDVTSTNNKQGLMVFGGSNVTFLRVRSTMLWPWTTFSGRPPVCGWSNEVVGSDERSACALHRREGKAITGLTTIQEAGFWLENATTVLIDDVEGDNRGAIIYTINSDNVTIRNSYWHNCSSGCISLQSGNWSNMEIYDNRFHDYPNAIQTANVMNAGDTWDAWIYNNRFNTVTPYGGIMEIRGPSPAAPTPNVQLMVYQNSSSGNKNGIAWGGNVDGMPASIMMNNIFDHDFQHGQNINNTFRNDANGMLCADHSWSRGGGVPNAFTPVPANVDSGGVKAWDDTAIGFYSDGKWATIPATAQNAAIDIYTGTWTCPGRGSIPAVRWNSSAPQPSGTFNMGWQQ